MNSTEITFGTGKSTPINPLFLMSERERVELGVFLRPRAYVAKSAKLSRALVHEGMVVDGQEAELVLRHDKWEYCHVLGEINGIPTFRGVMEAWNDKGRCLVRLESGRLVVANKDSFVEDVKDLEEKAGKAAKSARGIRAITSDLLAGLIN